MLTAERLREVLNYDPETGSFIRLASKTRTDWVGRSAGGVVGNGYWLVSVDNKRYYGHRLAWLYMTGAWPENEIDHINRNRTDNSWPNLREATSSQNKANTGPMRRNTSGLKGVYWSAAANKYFSALSGKYLGLFNSREEASVAYMAAARERYGEYASGE